MSLVLAALVLLSLLPGLLLPARAQFLPSLETSSSQLTPHQFLPVFEQGNIELTPVFLDGRVIGAVSGFVRVNHSEPADDDDIYSASQRAQIIHSRLQKILTSMVVYASEYLPEHGVRGTAEKREVLAQNLHTFVRKSGQRFEVFLAFPRTDPPELVFTVTPADVARVRLDSSKPEAIATRVAAEARRRLLRAWEERQPPAMLAAARRAGAGLGLLAVVSVLLSLAQKRFQRHHRTLVARLHEEMEGPAAQQAQEGGALASRVQRRLNLRMSLRQRLSLVSFYRSSLFWGQALLWSCGIAWLASQFYWSRPFSNWVLGVSVRGLRITAGSASASSGWPPLDWLLTLGGEATIGFPLLILFLGMATGISMRAGFVLTDRYVNQWAQLQDSNRARLRAPTLSRSLRGWVRVGVYLLLAMVILYQLHQLGAVTQAVAILLGFLSFALSLASQNLLRDLIGGLMILVEDQFAVGDVVVIGDHGGLVERVGLRVTQLRNLDGELISIPNGTIATVRNLSSNWSRVNYALSVSIGADVDAVITLMDSVAQQLYQDADWSGLILEPPEVLGVDEISHSGILIRVLIKTQPLQQWAVAREYRKRLKQALDAAGIDVGVPRLDLAPPLDIHATKVSAPDRSP